MQSNAGRFFPAVLRSTFQTNGKLTKTNPWGLPRGMRDATVSEALQECGQRILLEQTGLKLKAPLLRHEYMPRHNIYALYYMCTVDTLPDMNAGDNVYAAKYYELPTDTSWRKSPDFKLFLNNVIDVMNMRSRYQAEEEDDTLAFDDDFDFDQLPEVQELLSSRQLAFHNLFVQRFEYCRRADNDFPPWIFACDRLSSAS